MKLLLIPGLCEAFFDGGLMIKIFGMPATFAFATGFILKAVGPALVIQAMFEVQQKRLGVRKGDDSPGIGMAYLIPWHAVNSCCMTKFILHYLCD